MGLRMQPRNEKFFTLFSKAGSNVVESAANCLGPTGLLRGELVRGVRATNKVALCNGGWCQRTWKPRAAGWEPCRACRCRKLIHRS